MSDSRPKWPEGVPELPRLLVMIGLHTQSMTWEREPMAMYLSHLEAVKNHESTVMPILALVDGRVVWANRTARELGIVPENEQQK